MPADGLRVMTWNLLWRFGRWRERQPGILSTLAATAPDVAGLQEVWSTADTTQAQWLADQLGMHCAFAAPSLPPPPHPPRSADEDGVEVGVAVLSRWPLPAVRVHRLPSRHRPEIVALAAEIEHPRGPLTMVTSNLDWGIAYGEQRVAQARSLAGVVADASQNGSLLSLLVGDLNAPPDTPEIQLLSDTLVDTWVAARGSDDPGITLSSDNPLAPRDAWQIDRRIDYIFARPLRLDRKLVVDRAYIVGDAANDLPPSDHYAVVAEIGL
jgi:endonuclease/exonuclease/phosphatase family metal-dependent hydrolase